MWATAFYTGMRVGEIQALAAGDVRLDNGVIRVHWGGDRIEGRQATKKRNRRKLPIVSALRELLVAELLRTGRRDGELIFGATPSSPFTAQGPQHRADTVWEKAGLTRLTFHDRRQPTPP